MDNCITERFPWMASIHGKFFEAILSDSGIGTLEHLQWNITVEVERLEHYWNFKTAKLLLKGVEHFYFYYCRICSFENKDFPGFFTFSSEMKSAWSYILSSFFKICLLLSQGKVESKWIIYALKEISRFPGEQNLLLDALLLVQRLNKRYKDAYGAILQTIIGDMTSFVPVIFHDPPEFLKVYLLVRRLKLRIKCAAEKVHLHCRVSKCLAPPSLWDWLLDHGFTVPWTKKGIKKVNLGMDLCSKLGGRPKSQLKIVKALRKILLPVFYTKRKTEQQSPCIDQILSENDREITVNEGKVKRRKLKKLRNNTQEDGKEGMSVNRPEIQELTDISEENVSCMINHISAISTFDDKLVREKKSKKKRKSVHSEQNLHYDTGHADLPFEEDDNEKIRKNKSKFKSNMVERWKNNIQEDGEEGMSINRCEIQEPTRISEKIDPWAISSFDDDKLVSEKKSKKKGKSVHVEENLHLETEYTGLTLQECSSEAARLDAKMSKKQRKQKLNKIARKVLNEADQSIYKDSCVVKDNVEDQEEVMGRRKWTEMDYEDKEYCVGKNGYEGEPKSKKKRRKEKIAAEKIPDNENVTSSELEDISQNAKITKSKRRMQRRQNAKKLGTNSKETKFITDKNESDADDSPVIVEEIYVRVTPKKEDHDFNYSDDDRPVILKEVMPSPDSDLDFSHRKKSKDTKIELESNPRVENEIAENIFILDSKPSPCISDSGALLDNQTSLSMNDLEDKLQSVDNVISSTTEVHSGHTAQTKEEPSQESVVQTESLDNSPHKISDLVENCIKSDPISEELVEGKKKIPIQTDFEMETIERTNISQETVPVLDLHGSSTLDCSSLNGDNSAPKVEKQKGEHPSIKTDEIICVKNEYFSESNHTDTITTENNAQVIVENELSSQDSMVSCNVKKEKLTQENQVSDSSIDSPLGNTSCLKTDGISQQNLVATNSSESVDISSPERINSCNIKIKSESPLETLELHGSPVSDDSSLNSNNSAQKVEKRKDGHSSVKTDKQISVKNEVNFSETNHIDTETENNAQGIAENELSSQDSVVSCNVKKEKLTQENQVLDSTIDSPLGYTSCLKTDGISQQNLVATDSSESVDISSPEMNVGTENSNCSNNVKSEQLESLSSDSSLPDKAILEVVSDSDNDSSIKVDTPKVKKESDDTSSNMHRPSQNNSTDDQPNYQVAGLFFDAKSPISNSEGLPKDSDGSPNQQMLAKSSQAETPNTSAARVTIENMLTLAEFAGCHKESIKQIFSTGDLASKLNSVSKEHLLKFTSSAVNEKPLASVSFLDIAAENVGSLNKSHSFSHHTSETSEYLQYRNLSSDEDNRSEDTASESKSALKSDSSESASEVSIDSEGEESNSLKDYNSPVSSCQEEDSEHDTTNSQGHERDASTTTKSMNIRNLNPVVNLGVRCDSKNFIDRISNVSADSIIVPTSSSTLPDIKTENEEINETRTFNPNETSSTDNLFLNPVNETAGRLDSIQQSDARKCDEISTVSIDVKMEFQPQHEDVKEPCLIGDQELTGSGEDHKSVELTETRNEKGLSLSMDLRKRSVTANQTEEPMPDEGLGVLNEDIPGTHCMTLRRRHSSSASSEGNSLYANEVSTTLNPDILETNCKTMRIQNPSSPSSQETLAPANEGSNPLIQGAPVTRYMNLRGRNSTMSSSQEKSAPADEVLSVAIPNTPATRRRNPGNKNPSTPPNQEAKKRRSPTVARRSSKRLKREVNLNLGFDFSELSLNSPRALRSKPKESSTSDQENPCRKSTRLSVMSTTEDARLKEKDIDPEGYNLRSRKSVIMPGKLQL